MENKEEIKNKIIMNTSLGKYFLITISVFSCLFLGYLFYAGNLLKQSQKDIKDSYYHHICKADSVYYNISNYNSALIGNVQKINSMLLADSLIKYSLSSKQKLSEVQSQNLKVIISTYFEQLDLLQEQYRYKLSCDSLRLATERFILKDQEKSMIDLHLTKIDHEYNNIAIWAAVLTIVFLVFSFYSIFKMDEFIQQGYQGIKDIRELKKDGEKHIGLFMSKSKEQQDSFNSELNSLKESYLREISNLESENQERMEAIRNDFVEKANRIENEMNGMLVSYYNLIKAANERLQSKKNEEE